MAITVSSSAAEHIRKSLTKRGAGIGLRIKVKPDGCSGYSYVVDYAEALQADDTVFEDQGVKIIIDAVSLPMLEGTEIDYVSKGLNRTLEFHNPQAEHLCGCGESFSLKTDSERK